MSVGDITPEGPPEPDDVNPGSQPLPPDPFDYADDSDWVGDVSTRELTPEQEAYRAEAYTKVVHYTADYQIPVFPLWWTVSAYACACPDGINCDRKGKHPLDVAWPEVATDDAEQAARWWRPLAPGEERVDWRPRANIGIMMGIKHFLLNVDMGEGQEGEASLTSLITVHKQDMPHTLMYATGGGGRQHVMLIPPDVEVRNSVGELGDNLDVRGHHGFGIVPPSRSGKGEYRGVVDTVPVAPPGWLADWLREEQEKRTKRLEALPKVTGALGTP